jgi:hypothetical protein
MLEVVNTREVKNISGQALSVSVKEQGSELFPPSGNIRIIPGMSIIAEEDRFDLMQIQSIERKRLIMTTIGKQVINIGSGTGSGSGIPDLEIFNGDGLVVVNDDGMPIGF